MDTKIRVKSLVDDQVCFNRQPTTDLSYQNVVDIP
jgi:hypothetical protein